LSQLNEECEVDWQYVQELGRDIVHCLLEPVWNDAAVIGGVAPVEFSVIDSIDRPDSSSLISASVPVCSASSVHAVLVFALARFFLVSGGRFPHMMRTNREP